MKMEYLRETQIIKFGSFEMDHEISIPVQGNVQIVKVGCNKTTIFIDFICPIVIIPQKFDFWGLKLELTKKDEDIFLLTNKTKNLDNDGFKVLFGSPWGLGYDSGLEFDHSGDEIKWRIYIEPIENAK